MGLVSFLIVFLGSLIAVALLNAAEASLVSLNQSRLKRLLAQERHSRWVHVWQRRGEEFLLTVFLVRNLGKLVMVLSLFLWLDTVWSLGWWLTAAISFATGAVVIVWLGEVLPRSLGRAAPERVAGALIQPLRAVSALMRPLNWAVGRLIAAVGRLCGTRTSIFSTHHAQPDLLEVLDLDDGRTGLQEAEREMITSIVEFRDTIAREVMTPRVDIVCVNEEAVLAEVHRVMMAHWHSRIPVYHRNLDNIIGVIYVRDLLQHNEPSKMAAVKAKEVMHDILFVPETKKVGDLLREFQRRHIQIAVVVDEYGGTAGLVTVEDLLEEIVGEIHGEFEEAKELFVRDGEGGYVVDARMSIGDIEDRLGIRLPEDEAYDTIGGFIFTRLGKVPERGEVLRTDGVRITILNADGRRIYKVRLQTTDASSESREAAAGGGD